MVSPWRLERDPGDDGRAPPGRALDGEHPFQALETLPHPDQPEVLVGIRDRQAIEAGAAIRDLETERARPAGA